MSGDYYKIHANYDRVQGSYSAYYDELAYRQAVQQLGLQGVDGLSLNNLGNNQNKLYLNAFGSDFARADVNNDNKLDVNELSIYVKKKSESTNEEDRKKMIGAFILMNNPGLLKQLDLADGTSDGAMGRESFINAISSGNRAKDTPTDTIVEADPGDETTYKKGILFGAQQVLKHADSDNSGSMSIKEFAQYIHQPDVSKAAVFDTNNDDVISREELILALQSADTQTSTDPGKRDGKVSKQDLFNLTNMDPGVVRASLQGIGQT